MNLDFNYIDGLGPFFPLSNIELHRLPLIEGFEPIALNGRIMNKNIPTPFLLNKTVPFGVAEPFNLSGCHTLNLPPHLVPSEKR